jgi:flavin reductase (DIM6/NTAB) family NADH-FMN oxidoreductase RutF
MQTHPDRYFYEPVKGHELAHDPLNAIIAPRPIGWVSSRGQNGTLNLAPYSFFNAFSHKPPIIGFSSIGPKDSLRNVSETREFVWNLATRELAERMNETSASVPYGIDEFELANLTPVASRIVSVPQVAESPVNFECKVRDIIQLTDQNRSPVQAWLVLGDVAGVPIREELLKDGVFDTFNAGIILRAGGLSDYAEVRPEIRFNMGRPARSRV